MCVDQFEVFRCTKRSIMADYINEVKHLGSGLIFLVEILSKPSNNLKKSFLENIVHIVWTLSLVTGAK